MLRKRDGLLPVREALADLPGPVQALRKSPPPAQRYFTQADQVNQLVRASEADPDLGFMARMMALCSLPRTNPGNRKEYKRFDLSTLETEALCPCGPPRSADPWRDED